MYVKRSESLHGNNQVFKLLKQIVFKTHYNWCVNHAIMNALSI